MAGQIQDMVKADMANSHEVKAGDIKGVGKVLRKILDTSILSYFL